MTKNNFEDEFKKRYPKKYWKRKHYHRTHWYEPFYDEDVDFNTNAKSYYDYLARFNGFIRTMIDFINRLMRRNIKTEDTPSINFNKKGDWFDNGSCDPHYDDVITLNANVKISKQVETKSYNHLSNKNHTITNGSKIKNDGVWSPDYVNVLNTIDKDIGKINNDINNLDGRVTKNENDINNLDGRVTKNENDIKNIKNDINKLTNGLQKIIDNLYESGAITNNNINNFEFNKGRDIATGNINLFGGSSDGTSFIKTSNKKTENDITAGY